MLQEKLNSLEKHGSESVCSESRCSESVYNPSEADYDCGRCDSDRRNPERISEVYVDAPDDQIGFPETGDDSIFDFKWNSSLRRLEPTKVHQRDNHRTVGYMKILVSFSYSGDTINSFVVLENKIGSKACYRDIAVIVIQPAQETNNLAGLCLGYSFRKGQISGRPCTSGTATVEQVAGIKFFIALQNIDLIDDFLGPGKNAYRIEIPKQVFTASHDLNASSKHEYKCYVHIDEDVFSPGVIDEKKKESFDITFPVGQTFQIVLDTHITEKNKYYEYLGSGPSVFADKDGLPVSYNLPELLSGCNSITLKTEYPRVEVQPVYTSRYTQDKDTGKYVTDECKMKLSYKLFVKFTNNLPMLAQQQDCPAEPNNPECRAIARCVSRLPFNLN